MARYVRSSRVKEWRAMVRYDDVHSRALAEKSREGFVIYCKGRLLPFCDECERGFDVAVGANALGVNSSRNLGRLTGPHSTYDGPLAAVFPRCFLVWAQRHRKVEALGYSILGVLI